jgi:hypothetical protein
MAKTNEVHQLLMTDEKARRAFADGLAKTLTNMGLPSDHASVTALNNADVKNPAAFAQSLRESTVVITITQ